MFVERLWFENSVAAKAGRVVLAPLSWAFGAGVRLRNALYDSGTLRSTSATIPVASVGNLSVGGTGKTPFVAFLAGRLQAAGATPTIVMRGVGDDETRAYAQLAPGVHVVVDADRVRGVTAAARRGADVVLLDDAFQHRRIRRDVDVVLLSADRADSSLALLPAGPQREPFTSLSRASLAVIVRKAAEREAVRRLSERVRHAYGELPIAEIALLPEKVVGWLSSREASLDSLRSRRILAVAAIGDPVAFLRQLGSLAQAVEPMVFRDHHQFTENDVATITARAARFDMVVSTLKDAVKLGPRWPRQGSELWYVCQRLDVERGDAEIDRMLARLLDLRPVHRQ